MERLWQEYFTNPFEWWDNRNDKLHLNSPDFKHKRTKKALWINSRDTPPWVKGALHRKTASSGTAGSTLESGTSHFADSRTGNAVDVRPSQDDEFSWTARIWQHTKCGQSKQALKSFEEMQKAGVKPTSYTFVAALKACSTLQDLETVKEIHAQVAKSGVTLDVYMGTMLVDVYSKCGSLADAAKVFEQMPHRNVVSWNAMILGYAQMEEGSRALELYGMMQTEGVVPDDRTFVGALKACRSLAASEQSEARGIVLKKPFLEQVRAIHAEAGKKQCDLNIFVANLLVDVYAKCGSLVDAKSVFEKMPRRNVVSWTAMILGYAHMGQGKVALQLYAQMQLEGVVPNERTFVAVLKACSSLAGSDEGILEEENLEEGNPHDTKIAKRRCAKEVEAIHIDLQKSGCESSLYVATMLVDAYAKCGNLVAARRIFEMMAHRNVVSWNAIILGYAQTGEGEEALKLFARMQQQNGVIPDDRTFVAALKACTSLAALAEGDAADRNEEWLEQVRAIHLQAVKSTDEPAVFVGSMLVDAYAKCQSLVDARRVFEQLTYRNVVTWNTMILGCARMGEGKEALKLYTQMQHEGVVANEQTISGALKACSALATLEEVTGSGANRVKKSSLEQVKVIHTDIEKMGLESAVSIGNMLVDAYANCCSLVDARQVFDKMPQRDVVSWNTMILGCAQMDKGDEALQLYRRMQGEGVVPNHRTFVSVLKACSVMAALEKGKEIHSHISKIGVKDGGLFVAATLIDMYGRCGSMEDAQLLFDELPRRDAVSWSALIAGYAHHGDSEAVFNLFQRMRQEGVRPDSVTFSSILAVCSRAGLLEKGQEYLEAMSKDYGITPTTDHHNCVVDLLGRAGKLDEAIKMAKTLKPSSLLWKTVLGACRKWNNVELGKEAFEAAVRLDKTDAAAYILMSNIYAAAHMLEEAKKVQAMRVQARARKVPGKSLWTDTGGTVHAFGVGDKNHADSQDIYAKLRDLLPRLKKEGYVPHLQSVLRDIPDHEKEEALCSHSERLAIAYALLKTPKGTTIRVVKNLRVCEDCHAVTALISKIEHRTIICRDASRFHVYKDGKCSCGGYW